MNTNKIKILLVLNLLTVLPFYGQDIDYCLRPFRMGDCPDGKGYRYYSNGKQYDGMFKNGYRDGKGVLYFTDIKEKGERFKGIFRNDRMVLGTYHYENGDSAYNAQFQNDLLHGGGNYFFNATKLIYNGEFRTGKKHGEGIVFDSLDWIIKEGLWINDEFLGFKWNHPLKKWSDNKPLQLSIGDSLHLNFTTKIPRNAMINASFSYNISQVNQTVEEKKVDTYTVNRFIRFPKAGSYTITYSIVYETSTNYIDTIKKSISIVYGLPDLYIVSIKGLQHKPTIPDSNHAFYVSFVKNQLKVQRQLYSNIHSIYLPDRAKANLVNRFSSQLDSLAKQNFKPSDVLFFNLAAFGFVDGTDFRLKYGNFSYTKEQQTSLGLKTLLDKFSSVNCHKILMLDTFCEDEFEIEQLLESYDDVKIIATMADKAQNQGKLMKAIVHCFQDNTLGETIKDGMLSASDLFEYFSNQFIPKPIIIWNKWNVGIIDNVGLIKF